MIYIYIYEISKIAKRLIYKLKKMIFPQRPLWPDEFYEIQGKYWMWMPVKIQCEKYKAYLIEHQRKYGATSQLYQLTIRNVIN
jgi:hypothetical protein